MKAAFLDKIVERLDRLDSKSLHAHFLRLVQEHGLMDTIFQSIQEGILVLDSEGKILYANGAVERLTGLKPDEINGRPIARYLRDIDWGRILDFDADEWSRMSSHEIEVTYPERRFLSFYVAPLDSTKTENTGVLVMLRDVTEAREHEASLLESERVNAIRLLAAGVAHEIGNPLNALNIHLQLINRELNDLETEKAEPIRELLDVATKEVQRLDLITTQFLRAIRPIKPNLTLSSVQTILKETLTLLKTEIENRDIHVEIDASGSVPRIEVDPQQIKQAFFNVIKNAFQAMPDGGYLTIKLSTSERFLAVSFEDSGHGIDRREFGRLFEPYYTTKPEGSGLGLLIVQRIVQDHGGAIEVTSEPDVGTVLTILLPLAERQMRLLRAQSVSVED